MGLKGFCVHFLMGKWFVIFCVFAVKDGKGTKKCLKLSPLATHFTILPHQMNFVGNFELIFYYSYCLCQNILLYNNARSTVLKICKKNLIGCTIDLIWYYIL